MTEFEWVTKAEYSPVKKELEEIIKRAQILMRKKYKTSFQFQIIGSGKRHLITRIKGGNKGYDFDYNLIVPNPGVGVFYNAKALRNQFRDAFNQATKGTPYKCPEDSTSVLTIKVVNKAKSAVEHSADFAIVYYDTEEDDDGYYYIKNFKDGRYDFEFRNLSRNVEWKIDDILEYQNGWNFIRDEYLKLKNRNQDPNKSSFVLYLESVHNVHNWLRQMEEHE